MRAVEVGLVLTLAVCAYLVFHTSPGRGIRTPGHILSAVLLVTLMFHLIIEGPRLQAVPIYVAVGLTLTVLFGRFAGVPSWIQSAAILLFVLAGAACCHMVPVFQLPPPTGRFAIGTTTIHLTDTSRTEVHGPRKNQPRRFVAQIWYPVESCAGYPRSLYREPETLPWKLAHLTQVETHSCVDASPLAGTQQWPVVFFSPMSGGYRSQNTYLLEDLASHGYVTVAVDHPYSSSRVRLSNGEVIHSLLNDWINIDTRRTWAESLPRVEATLATRARDVQHVYDQLKNGTVPGIAASLTTRIDFARAAAIGHSFGGAVAVELCRKDPRFVAGVNLDGWMFGGFRDDGVRQPFLFVIEDYPKWKENTQTEFSDDFIGMLLLGTVDYHTSILKSISRWGGYVLRPFGATHGHFTDVSLYSRWPFPGALQNTDKALHISREFVRAFLDKHLQGQKPVLLAVSATTTSYELYMRPPGMSR